MNDYNDRIVAIRRYLEGEAGLEICTNLKRSYNWFLKWKKRYGLYGLDGLKDLSKAPENQARKIPETTETMIVNIRKSREKRERGETKYALVGAVAIQRELDELGLRPPSVRTIHRILKKSGLVVPPSPEKNVREIVDRHYPSIAIDRPGQLQQLDLVGPRYLTGSNQTYYFCNLRDVHSLKVAMEVGKDRKAATVVQALIRSWRRLGVPGILQHDNGLEFRGSNRYPRSAGLLTKLCLRLGVESLFIPARQPYRNGSVENFNGLFQRLLLKTQTIESFEHLQKEVKEFENTANTRHPHIPLHGRTSVEHEQSLDFRPKLLPEDFGFGSRFKFDGVPDGKVSFICRIRRSGRITIANEKFEIAPELAYEYVYATIFVKEQRLKIYHNGSLVKEFPYELSL